MGNNQLLPFERNRYYVGKLLTSADFQAEQAYGNSKRRFMNGMMFGSGIVCGLSVYSLDDLSIMVDSGVAVDGLGHEIAVESPIVRKLSAIDGFESLETERAVLCLKYSEEDVHPIYSVGGGADRENYECNRVREGWQLFLQDSSDIPEKEPPATEFHASSIIYSDADYIITCKMPAKIACGASVRLEININRLNPAAGPISLKATLQTPAFTDGNGDHELVIDALEVCPEKEITLTHYLKARPVPAPESVILADADSISVSVSGQQREVTEGFVLHTSVIEATVDEIVDEAATYAGLEMRGMDASDNYVVLGELVLQRTRSAYLIEDVKSTGVRSYIRTAATDKLRRELEAWFKASGEERQTAPEAVTAETESAARYTAPVYATGLCEISLGANMRRGQIAYSDEIVHGLGPGTVYVTVGAEYLADDAKLGAVARNTIYGNSELFGDNDSLTVQAETAVKVLNDRGSFVVAAKLLEDSRQVVMPLRWIAIALPTSGEEDPVKKIANKSIAAAQPTVVMATRESCFINVRFNNMEPCTLTYELTENDSGTITSDGIYTAPGREGVFEIRISCADMPLIFTYAYVVVKKRDVNEVEE